MNFLEEKSLVQSHPESHFCLLKKLWFDLYPRGKKANMTSSGFEHVFLAESKKTKLIGFHNWLYFHEMERSGALNYKGWERIIDLGDVS
jgi:poly(U)-specific endoribonuclease